MSILNNVIAEGQAAGQFLPGDPKRQAFFFFAFINGYGMMHSAELGDSILDEAVQAALRLIVLS
ncbi:hypothetical protein [Cohnella yongneupensis]|uniref:TetR family transcriptional regulator n=1 Tax=Cohnella yongneupensis TaxID=425006 RepID=A0ABW0R3A7_9BACL